MTAGDPNAGSRSPADLAERICGWAREEGFDDAALADLEPASTGEAFLGWLERGDHAGMEYMTRRVEARLEPERILEGAASVLCVTLRYHPLEGEDDSVGGDLWPKVARYARGRDYHRIMTRGLKALARRIESELPGTGTRWYVDTGPVLERELAARAGLGAIGKNTCLLHRTHGSWFFLGELFLTLPLAEPGIGSAAVEDMCGSCTLCLDACPTDALADPYRLDSRRCISYWTIEHRGPIPREMRESLEGWVFGCDVCQEVCPWNRKERGPAAEHEELELPGERRRLDLIGLLGLDREGYVDRFAGGAMKRAKLEGLQRNAALAMGFRGEDRYVKPLADALATNPSPVVRGAAAWSLGRLASKGARISLQEALRQESDRSVREEISRALQAPDDAVSETPRKGPVRGSGLG